MRQHWRSPTQWPTQFSASSQFPLCHTRSGRRTPFYHQVGTSRFSSRACLQCNSLPESFHAGRSTFCDAEYRIVRTDEPDLSLPLRGWSLGSSCSRGGWLELQPGVFTLLIASALLLCSRLRCPVVHHSLPLPHVACQNANPSLRILRSTFEDAPQGFSASHPVLSFLDTVHLPACSTQFILNGRFASSYIILRQLCRCIYLRTGDIYVASPLSTPLTTTSQPLQYLNNPNCFILYLVAPAL